MFDFSNYSAKSKFFDSNKLLVGKLKDETVGIAIKEFLELKSKCIRFGQMIVVTIKKQKV